MKSKVEMNSTISYQFTAHHRCNKIITHYGLTEEYSPMTGLDQGGVDCPLLWRIFYDPLLCFLQKHTKGYKMDYKSTDPLNPKPVDEINVPVTTFMDDTAIFANNMVEIICGNRQYMWYIIFYVWYRTQSYQNKSFDYQWKRVHQGNPNSHRWVQHRHLTKPTRYRDPLAGHSTMRQHEMEDQKTRIKGQCDAIIKMLSTKSITDQECL